MFFLRQFCMILGVLLISHSSYSMPKHSGSPSDYWKVEGVEITFPENVPEKTEEPVVTLEEYEEVLKKDANRFNNLREKSILLRKIPMRIMKNKVVSFVTVVGLLLGGNALLDFYSTDTATITNSSLNPSIQEVISLENGSIKAGGISEKIELKLTRGSRNGARTYKKIFEKDGVSFFSVNIKQAISPFGSPYLDKARSVNIHFDSSLEDISELLSSEKYEITSLSYDNSDRVEFNSQEGFYKASKLQSITFTHKENFKTITLDN